MSSSPLSDLDPLLQALDDLVTGLRAINHQPPAAWPAVGPLGGTARDGGPLLHCVLCGQPISGLYRRGPDPAAPTAHWDRGTCLTTITYIARFVLAIFSASAPRPAGKLLF
ncbi:MAG: hypothetical protein M3Z04_11945 [Chloroflexota bacterium]|nr:hypothetical protein [Chloroflexota bacterium]